MIKGKHRNLIHDAVMSSKIFMAVIVDAIPKCVHEISDGG